MTSYAWVALAAVAAPALFGFGIVRWLGLAPAEGLRIALGSGYVVGQYVLAHATLAWLALGKPFPGFLLPIAAAAAGALLVRCAHRRSPPLPPRVPSPWWSWLPVALLALALLEAFTAANAEPVHHSDEALNWAAKAKLLYTAPGFDLTEGLAFFVKMPDYPLFNPLAQALAYASAGRVLQFENRLPIQFFGVALLLVLSAALARRARPVVATLALVAFAGSGFAWQAPTAYADVQLACCTLVAAEMLLRWRERRDGACFAIACLAGGAMIATKNEGLLLAAALALPTALEAGLQRWRGRAPGLASPRLASPGFASPGLTWRSAAWLAAPLAAWALHRGINAWYGLENDLVDPALAHGRGLLTRIVDQMGSNGWPVLRHYGAMFVDAPATRLLPLSFLVAAPVALWLDRRAWSASPVAPLAAAFAVAIAGYMLVFVGTPHQVQWHLDTAADRTLQHVLPLAALGLAVAVARARPAAA
jgi:hypothetical protein